MMNKLLLLGGAAAVSAVSVDTHSMYDAGKFLNAPELYQEPIRTEYEAFGQGNCQYIFNFGWYDFTNYNYGAPAFCSSSLDGQ